MDEEKRNVLERIAVAFPKLTSEEKAYVAGYITRAEEERAQKQPA